MAQGSNSPSTTARRSGTNRTDDNGNGNGSRAEQAPRGEQGAKGERGEPGPAGQPGARGRRLPSVMQPIAFWVLHHKRSAA